MIVEFSMIKMHSQAGHDIFQNVELPWPIADIILQHHERLDGSGYPRGLAGKDILLSARIIAVADVIEAMASHRPYRPALGIDKALEFSIVQCKIGMEETMSEENKAVVRKYYELLDKGDMGGMMGLFSDTIAWRFTGMGELDKKGLEGLIQGFGGAFPDMCHTIDLVVAEGDVVATSLTFAGTHNGELMGIPPSGKKVEVRGMNMHRIAGGKIVDAETVVNMMALMQQIGAIPS